MHELALMQSVVEAVSEQLGNRRILTIRLEVGRLTCVVPDALRFCFDVCTRGTPLEGSKLDILERAGRARCSRCESIRPISHVAELCPCGGVTMSVLSGQELRIKEVEVI